MKCAWRSFLLPNKFAAVLARMLLIKFVFFAPCTAAGADAVKKNIYANASAWSNEKGETVSLAELKGKKSVFALFYTGCKTICPMTAKSVQAIEKALGKNAADVQFVLISIDPAADKAPQLRQFIRNNKIKNWKVLAGSVESTKNLAIELGVGFEEKRGNPDLHQLHSRNLIVVSETGEIAGELPIFEFDMDQAKKLLD